MSTQFRIFNEKDFAHRKTKPDKYVCYRTVLSHALQRKLRITNRDEARNTFLKLKKAVDLEQQFTDDEFVFFYPVKMGSKTGYLIIDKSRGYYPLVLYPFKVTGGTRTQALKMVLKDMAENIDALLTILQREKSWNAQLQANLQDRVFHYAEDRKNWHSKR